MILANRVGYMKVRKKAGERNDTRLILRPGLQKECAMNYRVEYKLRRDPK
jgi:hypothetical protein